MGTWSLRVLLLDSAMICKESRRSGGALIRGFLQPSIGVGFRVVLNAFTALNSKA